MNTHMATLPLDTYGSTDITEIWNLKAVGITLDIASLYNDTLTADHSYKNVTKSHHRTYTLHNGAE